MPKTVRVRAVHLRRRPISARRAIAQSVPVKTPEQRPAPVWLVNLAGILGFAVTALAGYGIGVLS